MKKCVITELDKSIKKQLTNLYQTIPFVIISLGVVIYTTVILIEEPIDNPPILICVVLMLNIGILSMSCFRIKVGFTLLKWMKSLKTRVEDEL